MLITFDTNMEREHGIQQYTLLCNNCRSGKGKFMRTRMKVPAIAAALVSFILFSADAYPDNAGEEVGSWKKFADGQVSFKIPDRWKSIDPFTVDTLHWEGYREGYDDLRYLATLEKLIQKAKRLDGPVGETARGAELWTRRIDPETTPLDEIRAEMIERILAIREALP